MTHRWGFDLSMSAVRLMRRDAGHWLEVASESMDGGALDARLKALADQVPEPKIVDIFLPRDQILYTDVKLADPKNALPEIEAAMDGRTPYTLDEMEIDWATADDGTARVAAIARTTLSEAEDFVGQCGLKVSWFSSFPEDDDFPRQPDFGTGNALNEDIEAEDTPPRQPENVPRKQTDPKPVVPLFDETPVIQVDDPAPVIATEPDAPPSTDLAAPHELATPRVRTDVSLPETGGRAAASLTPPEPLDPYGKSEPDPEKRKSNLVLGLAVVLTLAIVVIVWAIFPDNPDTGATAVEREIAPPVAELSDVPPSVTDDLEASTAAPAPSEEPNPPSALKARGERITAASLPEVTTSASPLPERPSELGPRPEVSAATPTALASVEPGAETPALDFETPVPPVTRPGNVALQTAQSFSAGVAPPPGEAPEYVPPAPPVIAALPEEVIEDDPIDPEPPAEGIAEETEIETEVPETEVVAEATAPEEITEVPAPEAAETIALPEPEPEADAPAETEVAEAPQSEEADLPTPTALAAAVPNVRSRPRPTNFTEEIERQSLGGRTASELAQIRPPPRPQSAQGIAEAERANAPPSALAVAVAPSPRLRPANLESIAASVRAAQRAAERERQLAALPNANTSNAVRAAIQEEEEEEAAAATAARNSPRLAIPSNTNVARQATVDDGINLRQINLVGVYGLPTDRRALIRLPSGRYVKVKIGDKVDGGTVAAITDSALQYRKGGRTIQLSMPQG